MCNILKYRLFFNPIVLSTSIYNANLYNCSTIYYVVFNLYVLKYDREILTR